MYLKYIRASGFKSFADKTEIEFKPGITGIVGPNGSGKSNIVDAIRWVLGEQSVKNLRGDSSMSDIIFTGSSSRNGDNHALVALTFDNTDHYLNSEYNEIEIKRVLYKTGENEYYINNSKVRLKDIADLFLDTGASKESFNIISQGAIADIVNSRPIDRRVIFEEAAGVLKYKKRKEETLRKLAKTNDNLEKINLLADELLVTLTPLKEQASIAQKYLDYNETLQKQEIALIAHDISKLSQDEKETKDNIEKLTKEIQDLSNTYTVDDANLEKLKLEELKLDSNIENKNKDIMYLVNELSELESKKQITIERKKYEVDDQKLESNIINLKEEILKLNNTLKTNNKELDILNKDKATKNLEIIENKKILETIEKDRDYNQNISNKLNKEILQINNKIEIITDNINNDSKLPYAIKNILNNVRLKGIHNIFIKLIEVSDKYSTAIETSLGSSSNVLVVDNELVAKEAISYLKENKLGRVTFYPLSIIKGKYISDDILKKIDNIPGYIGIASDLIKYDKKYKEIVLSLLGNIIVVDNIDSLNRIGKLIDYKYRVVSLDGEILYAGGAIAGGANKLNRGILSEKNELDNLNKELISKKEELDNITKTLEDINNKYQNSLDNYNKILRENSIIEDRIKEKNKYLNTLNNDINTKNKELEGTVNITNNSLDKELDDILKRYYEVSNNKEVLETELNKLKSDKFNLNNKKLELEKKYKEYNNSYNNKSNILKSEEIKLGKIDVKLDNLLLLLNETYSMTYERASKEYILDIDPENARLQVNNIKAKIKELGIVNTGSIAEYERINNRYEFLTKQKQDLEESITNLLSIIDEMDEIMKNNFQETFTKIKEEFAKVYKTLFKGGEGILSLTEPDNLLETGIEIHALPPGKKLNSIALLSGGEKTLTAIALLFAILNVKIVPFVVLDEVEAALDEANVETFGKYLKDKKDRSQFIIITHKKKTMEYADTLYGITMQESGVSKLVSVKLEDKNI